VRTTSCEDTADGNSDYNEEFLGFHGTEDCENSDSNFAGF
jgi:hypothetical protein